MRLSDLPETLCLGLIALGMLAVSLPVWVQVLYLLGAAAAIVLSLLNGRDERESDGRHRV